MSKEANNYTTKSNSTPLPTGKGVRLIISGGGTGGHIFPAISIANAIKELCPDAEILFVGAEGRMEMQRVPDAGYRIIGLPVAGFDRKHLWKNFSVLLKLIRSQWKARSIIKEFRPQVAVGVGGYASGPTLKMAGMMGIPTLIQEQNSYAGVTNKLLAQKACKICVAYEGMEKFFPAEKIIMTGNPVRQNLLGHSILHADAVKYFGLNPEKKTILILGGSLGARTINQTLTAGLDIRFQGRTDGGEFGKQSVDHIVILRGFPIDPLQDLPKLTPGGRFQFFFGVGFLHGVEHIGVENGPQKIQKLDHLGFQMGVVNHGPVPPVSQMTAKGRQYRIWQDRS